MKVTKYVLAGLLAIVSLTGPLALQSEAHHCHHHWMRNWYGGGGWNGYRGNGTFIDRLLGNGGGYGGRCYGYNSPGYYGPPGPPWWSHGRRW